ncbi:MAG: flagellar assembly protein FliW [Geminicoccaceae bacterium]
MTTATLDRPEESCATAAAVSEQALATLQSRFGPLAVDERRHIRFEGGLPGFPEHEVFQLDQPPGVETELLLLQAVDSSELSFFVMSVSEPTSILRMEDIAAAAQALDISADNLLLLLIVTFKRNGDGFSKFVNLRAPIFIDVEHKRGRQVVLPNPDYSLKFELT